MAATPPPEPSSTAAVVATLIPLTEELQAMDIVDDVDTASSAISSSPLATLPFPLGWQLLCDALPTRDILRLACTSREHVRIGFSMVRHLTVRLEGTTNDETISGDDANETTTTQATAEALARLFAKCTHLETLTGRQVDVVGMAQLAYAWTHHPGSLQKLRVLCLANAGLGEEGLAYLLPTLAMMPALEDLLLEGNGLGNSGAQALARELRGGQSCRRLKTLNLALNGIGASGARELAVMLAGGCGPGRLSPHYTQRAGELLECLSLDGNLIGPMGTLYVARAFLAGACPRLRALHLRNNDLRAEGLAELLNAFGAGACPKLSVLCLESNMFGGVGARLLAHALAAGACPDLEVLNLSYTFMGESGLTELTEAFRQGACKSLRQLLIKSACLRRPTTLDRLMAIVTRRNGPQQTESYGTAAALVL